MDCSLEYAAIINEDFDESLAEWLPDASLLEFSGTLSTRTLSGMKTISGAASAPLDLAFDFEFGVVFDLDVVFSVSSAQYGADLIMVATILGCSRYKEKVDILLSMSPQQVATFKVYPGVGRQLATFLKSPAYDPMLTAFFDALSEIQPYPTRRDTVKSWKHNWYLEVSAKGSKEIIQILFYIPSQQGSRDYCA